MASLAIESPSLIHRTGFIAGKWVPVDPRRMIPVRDPATGEHLSDVPDMTESQVVEAIEAADAAQNITTSIQTRRHWLIQIADALRKNEEEIARIITREQGKPLKESRSEVEYAGGFFRFFAGQLDHLAPDRLKVPVHNTRWTVYRRPAGVVALITPWNFPLAMLAKKLAPAIGAGCSVVAKPAELTPLTAIALWHLLEPIGFPSGLLNLVLGQPEPIGKLFCTHPKVRLISFTGSTRVGRYLIETSAPQIKRLALELGGNAPFIVMDDADVDSAVDALLANKFRCAGQTCVCANRIYVERGIQQAFLRAASERISKLRVGNGMDPSVDVGPLINGVAFEKVDRHVQDALHGGAKRLAGGQVSRPKDDWGAFYSPTLLSNTNASMLLAREETFGPIVAVQTFETEEEAISLANGTPYGLAAYLFTTDLRRATALIERLQFGHVGLNTGTGPTPEAPFGGMKQSGFGREGGIEGLMEFCELQTVAALENFVH